MTTRKANPSQGMSKATINLVVDAILLMVVAATVISAFVDKAWHVYLGLGTIPVLGLHLILHWELIEALLKRLWQGTFRFRWKWLFDLLMLLVFLPMVFSGMIVALIYAPQVSEFHEWSFYVFTSLVMIHLYTSRKWILHKLRRGWRGITHA